MKFAELTSKAEQLAPEQLEPALREMMRDPRFGAILRLLRDHRESLVQGGSAMSVAAHAVGGHLMAHYFGGVDALLTLEMRLCGICEEAERERAG